MFSHPLAGERDRRRLQQKAECYMISSDGNMEMSAAERCGVRWRFSSPRL